MDWLEFMTILKLAPSKVFQMMPLLHIKIYAHFLILPLMRASSSSFFQGAFYAVGCIQILHMSLPNFCILRVEMDFIQFPKLHKREVECLWKDLTNIQQVKTENCKCFTMLCNTIFLLIILVYALSTKFFQNSRKLLLRCQIKRMKINFIRNTSAQFSDNYALQTKMLLWVLSTPQKKNNSWCITRGL